MKKVMILLVIFAFLAGVLALRPAVAAVSNTAAVVNIMVPREKISSLEQINNYSEIIRQGTTLFGIRKSELATTTTTGASAAPAATVVIPALTASTNSATAASVVLEKIATPAMIPGFDKITKIGTVLWGVRKADTAASGATSGSVPAIWANTSISGVPAPTDGNMSIPVNVSPSAASTTVSAGNASSDTTVTQPAAANGTVSTQAVILPSVNIEKIATPAMISEFEKIVKIGTALWGVKKPTVISSGTFDMGGGVKVVGTNSGGVTTTTAPTIGHDEGGSVSTTTSGMIIVNPAMATCVAAAIDVKDKALIDRVNAAAAEMVTAITTRSTCQQAAIQSTVTNQREALTACVHSFQDSVKQFNSANQAAQAAAWKTYSSSLQACRANNAGSSNTTTGDIVIPDGSSADALGAVAQ